MKQEEPLEKKIKELDWKDFTPFLGAYTNIRKLSRGEMPMDWAFLMGAYHAAVSYLPAGLIIYKIIDKYL